MKKLLFLSGLLVVLGICMVSCGDDDIGVGEVTYYFGGDDLFYEIPAEGGSVSFPPDEYAPLRLPGPFMIINRPLSWFHETEDIKAVGGILYREPVYQFVFSYYQSGFSEEDIVLYELVDGYVVSAGESGDKDASPICARESVRMLYDSRKFYYGDVGWLGLHYYKGNGRYEVSAGPNDTGSDRYISFVYDYFGCNTGYGAVEIRQPARKTDNI